MSVCEVEFPAGSLLGLLHPAVLHKQVLAVLSPCALSRLACTSKDVHAQISAAAELWAPHCEGIQGLKGPPNMREYGSWRRTLCVECGQPTRYKFALLGCRLCMDCEPSHTRYGLVTEREARERYGLSDAELVGLSCVESCRTELYLRSKVVEVSRRGGGPHPAAQIAGDESGSSDSDEVDVVETSNRCSDEREAGPSHSTPHKGCSSYLPRDEGGAGCDEGTSPTTGDGLAGNSCCHSGEKEEEEEEGAAVSAAAAAAAELKAQRKSARKAAKKETKEAQRLKREAKAQGLPTTPSQYCLLSGNKQRSKAGRDSTPPAGLSTPPLPIPGLGVGCSRDRKKAKHRATQLQQKGLAARARSAGHRAPGELFLEGERVLGTSPKIRSVSGWLAERQAIMAEFGEYALSGLVLAD